MNRILSLLGIARRANFLSMGFESVKNAILKKHALLVLVANDMSDRTKREISRLCEQNHIEYMPIDANIFTITNALGFKTGCVAVRDEGFSIRIKEILCEFQGSSDTEEECII